MPEVSTLKAYLSLASRTLQMDIILVLGPHVCFTSRFWTPTHQFVLIEVLLLLKTLLFLI